jgi:protein SCO1
MKAMPLPKPGSITRRRLLQLLSCLPLSAFASPGSRQWLTAAPQVPDVTLLDSNNVAYRLKTLLAEQPVVIGFFFTRCNTACPVQTATLKTLQRSLLAKPEQGLLLSISLDPVNDTPAAMQEYAGRFKVQLGLEQRWLMLGGEGNALEQVWDAFDTNNGPPEAHSSSLWVGSPARRRWSRLDGFVSAADLQNWLEACTT